MISLVKHTYIQWPVPACNILVTQLRQAGDVLLTTPAVKALREQYPASRISYLTETGPATLLQGNPHLDAIITRDRKGGLIADVSLAYSLRKARFDLVIDFFCNPRSAWMSFVTGARHRIASYHAGRAWWYTYTPKIDGGKGYAAEARLALLKSIGIEGRLVAPILCIPDEAQHYIETFLNARQISDNTRIVTIDPTSRRQAKRWIPERYVQLADRLAERHAAAVVFIWGPGEQQMVQALANQGKYGHVLACQTDLMQLAALIARSHLHIGNCSAPRHIAAAVRTPSLTIMGPTDPKNWTYPASIHRVVSGKVPCLVCHKTDCASHDCMRTLTVDDVEEAAVQLLNNEVRESCKNEF